jgi:hypothetical protein
MRRACRGVRIFFSGGASRNVTPTSRKRVMYLGGFFSAHGFLPMVFYFRLRN